MKFLDTQTNVELETTNEFVIEQFKANDRYKEIKPKQSKTEK